LYDSVHHKIFSLPDLCEVYPAHEYKGRSHSTVGEEKAFNPRLRLTKTKEEFVEIMSNLNISFPASYERVKPINMRCGY